MSEPYWTDGTVTLHHGDMREVLPTLDVWADAVVTDPPYGETSLAWDRWPADWPTLVAAHTDALWCFGSMRMFTARWTEFDGWKFAQDIVWRKHTGTSPVADRFRRVHEHVLQFYRGPWRDLHRETPRVPREGKDQSTRKARSAGPHLGSYQDRDPWCDNGTRLALSVLEAKTMRGRAIHPTEKPQAILDPLIRYSVPSGGLVLDPFAGSGSTLLTARSLGRKAIGIEANEAYCEAAARRLSEPDLFAMAASDPGTGEA